MASGRRRRRLNPGPARGRRRLLHQPVHGSGRWRRGDHARMTSRARASRQTGASRTSGCAGTTGHPRAVWPTGAGRVVQLLAFAALDADDKPEPPATQHAEPRQQHDETEKTLRLFAFFNDAEVGVHIVGGALQQALVVAVEIQSRAGEPLDLHLRLDVARLIRLKLPVVGRPRFLKSAKSCSCLPRPETPSRASSHPRRDKSARSTRCGWSCRSSGRRSQWKRCATS